LPRKRSQSAVCCALAANDFADGIALAANRSSDSDSTAGAEPVTAATRPDQQQQLRAAKLLKKMLAAGVSQYDPAPIDALAKAGRIEMTIENSVTSVTSRRSQR
jgi:hypothetical protein